MDEIKVVPYIPDEDYDNPAMVVDFYEFTMANCLFLHGFKNTTLVFDMFFRKNPDNMGYSISAGQRKLTRFLLNYHFNEQDIRWLRTKGMSEEFCEYLRTYKWKGDMYALPEGTVCYPHVQMVRIECDLVGAILIETYLLQTMNFHSLIATKATRVTGLNTHTPRSVMEFGTRRAQGESAGNDGAYAAVLGGCIGTANCLAEMKYGSDVKAVGTVAHSFIEFFPTEFDAFKAFADTYPDSVSLLLDTYNIMESGLPNLIKLDDYLIEKYPNDPNRRVKSARIDSGDLARELLHYAALLHDIGIFISFSRHNAHSHYLIRNTELLGFTRREVDIMAALTYFHRKRPSKKVPLFMEFDQETREEIRLLSLFLLLAERMDKSHRQIVRTVRFEARKEGGLQLSLRAPEECPIELDLVRGSAKLVRKVFRQEIPVEVVSSFRR